MRTLLVTLAALVCAGCSATPAATTPTPTTATARDGAVKFAACMRDNGVKNFPDPGPSGELTADEIANGSPVDTKSAAWAKAITACKDLQPPGFTGTKRSSDQQEVALRFAQCIRDNGVRDFPDPDPNGPLIDTDRIPSLAHARDLSALDTAAKKCGAAFAGQLGLTGS